MIRTARQRRRYLNIVATGFFAAAAIAILFNVLAWQRTRHPAPLFSRIAPSASVKEPKIAEMKPVPAERSQPAITPPSGRDKPAGKPPLEGTSDGSHPHATGATASPAHDQISELLKTAPVREAPPPKPIAPKVTKETKAAPPSKTAKAAARATPSKSVLAAQRALVKLGFVLNPDGVAGKATRLAIESYERDHKLPVRGELTPALIRRLSAEAGTDEDR